MFSIQKTLSVLESKQQKKNVYVGVGVLRFISKYNFRYKCNKKNKLVLYMEIKTLVYISIFLMIISMSLNYYVNYYIVKANNVNDKKTNEFVEDTKQNLKSIENKIRDYINPQQKESTQKETVKPEIIKVDSIKENSDIKNSTEIDDELKKVNDELLNLRAEINKETKLKNEKTKDDDIKSNVDINKPKSTESDEKLKIPAKPMEEVFLVKNNIFLKNQGDKVCKALFNSKLATKEQLNDTYNNGANWCNYGWIEKSEAYYPLQNDTDNATCLGKKGLNGGVMDEDLNLGIHCYGVKPSENAYYPLDKLYNDSSMSDKDLVMLENYRKKLNAGGIKITPFNNNAWSKYSYKADTIKIGESTVVTEKNDKSKDPNSIKIEKVIVKELILPEIK